MYLKAAHVNQGWILQRILSLRLNLSQKRSHLIGLDLSHDQLKLSSGLKFLCEIQPRSAASYSKSQPYHVQKLNALQTIID